MNFTILKSAAFVLLINPMFLFAYDADTSGFYRKELQQLLQARQEKFASYSKSLEQRSGIFGNKTKNDIKESNQVLINLVKTDNHIIEVLNRVVDFRNYEKVTMNYDIIENKHHLKNLLQATDTLSKQVTVLTDSNSKLKSKNKKIMGLVYFLSFILILLFLKYRRNLHRNKTVLSDRI